MEDQNTTLNDGSDAAVLFDSSPDSPVSEESTETSDSSAETLNTDTEAKEEGAETAGESGKEATEEGKTEEDVRFDQHPRFKELHKSNKEMAARLAEMSAKIESLTANPADTRDFDAEFKKLDDDLESGDLSIAQHSAKTRKLSQEQAAEERESARRQEREQYQARELQDKFLKDRPYLTELLESNADEIAALIAESPMHDNVSAAMELRIKQLETANEKAIAEAVAKATKETEQKMLANFKAKQSARSLGEGARAASEPDPDAALKDTGKHGGVKNTLAERLKARRKAS